MYGMVRSIMIFLEIYLAFQQWKKFENPRITDKVITMSLVFYFLGHSVHAPSALSPSTARSRRRCQTGYSSCSVTSGLLQHYLSTYLGVDIASLQRVWHAAARTVLNLRLNDHVCLRRCVFDRLCTCRHVTIGTPMVIFAVLTVFWLFLTIGTLLLFVGRGRRSRTQTLCIWRTRTDHWCTNRHRSTKTVPTVYQSSKTVKRQSKQQKWPLVYQSSHVYTESAEYTKPCLPCSNIAGEVLYRASSRTRL